MKVVHVRLLRRVSLGLIVVVLLAVGLNYVLTWKRRLDIVQRATEILGTDMLRSADHLEYSEHRGGVLQFKLKAERLLETRQGTNLLQGIDAFDTNPDGTPRNQIRSERAEYDSTRRVVRFIGNVRVLTSHGLELRTPFLEYDRAQQVGTSKDDVQVASKEGTGNARGFRFEHADGRLEVNGPLQFTLRRNEAQGGMLSGGDLRIRADAAYYAEADQLVRLEGNARADSDSGTLSGDRIEARLNADRTAVTSLTCEGSAEYASADAGGDRRLKGRRLDFAIGESSRAVERIDIHGEGVFTATTPEGAQELRGDEVQLELEPATARATALRSRGNVMFLQGRTENSTQVTAGSLDASFFGDTGLLQGVRVWDRALMSTAGRTQGGRDELAADIIDLGFRALDGRSVPATVTADGAVRWRQTAPPKAGARTGSGDRTLRARRLEFRYASSGRSPESGSAAGDVVIEGLSSGDEKGAVIRRLKAEQVAFAFFEESGRLSRFDAQGHVETDYARESADAQETHSTSDRMSATFRAGDGSIDRLVQTGNVVFRDSERTATCGRSEYGGASNVLVLTESPRVSDGSGVTTGSRVEYDRTAAVLRVQGKVRSTLTRNDAGAPGPFASGSGAGPTIVTADSMEYRSEEGRARYAGRTQMLSEGSQLQVDSLEIGSGGETVHGEGNVRHLVIRADAAKPGRSGGAVPVLIRSRRLDYSKSANAVRYTGDVVLTREDLTIESDTLEAAFDAEGRQIEKASATANLRIRQGERRVRGDAAEYFLKEERVVVLGRPAEISDPARGKSAARRLTFFTSDDRILLETY